jgi:hypothetical protein
MKYFVIAQDQGNKEVKIEWFEHKLLAEERRKQFRADYHDVVIMTIEQVKVLYSDLLERTL